MLNSATSAVGACRMSLCSCGRWLRNQNRVIGGKKMARSLERDLIGYGGKPPHPNWPGGARIALNFVMNYEEGSEYSIGDGDGRTDTGLIESASTTVPRGERDLAAESMFEYGSRVGFW